MDGVAHIILSAILVISVALLGLRLSNFLFDRSVPQYLSRKAAHGFGGLAYLLGVLLFQKPLVPVLISASFTALLGFLRIFKPEHTRGVGGSARPHALAEVYFPLAGTLCLLIGWQALGDKYLALVPILFMAWGDMITGIVRSEIYRREVKGNFGSLAMLGVCCLVALLYHPCIVSLFGAGIAALIERFTPMRSKIFDDNWTVPLGSLTTMILIAKIV